MKKINLTLIATAIIASNCFAGTPKTGALISDDKTTVATTVYGEVEGYLDDGIYTFKGIPYAKAERFMPPQFPDKFDGLKQCKVYGPKAPQGQNFKWSEPSDYSFGFQFIREPMDEKNCLVLNVWTPSINDGKKRPVFVWFHGGGYASGSGIDLPCYEGRALAEKGDIVVVTVNHRLNILGYIDLSGLGGKYAESVNLGMQDLVKSLEWVRDNIANFGGDPSSVTIGGQSGGGGKVSTVLAMPSAKGLFSRAIVQSGSTLRQGDSNLSKKLGLAFIEELGLTSATINKIDDFTYEELVAAGQRAGAKLAQQGGGRVGFGPVVDGKFLPQHPFDPAAPEISRNVPMLIGSNLNEMTYSNNVEVSMADARKSLVGRMGEERADRFIKAFETVYPNQAPKELLYTDFWARPGAIKQATIKNAQGGAKAYLYLFTWKSQVSNGALGACHGMELPFMFNNIALQREMTGGTEAAYKLSDLMSSAWLSFIKTGDPNTKGLPTWEPYDPDKGATMIFDNKCEIKYNHDKAIVDINAETGR